MYTPRIDIVEKKLLSDNHYRLERITFDYQKPDGTTFRGCSEASATEVSIRAIGG